MAISLLFLEKVFICLCVCVCVFEDAWGYTACGSEGLIVSVVQATGIIPTV